jgi:hypothetical protein
LSFNLSSGLFSSFLWFLSWFSCLTLFEVIDRYEQRNKFADKFGVGIRVPWYFLLVPQIVIVAEINTKNCNCCWCSFNIGS